MFSQERRGFPVQSLILKETSPGIAVAFRNRMNKSTLVTVEVRKFTSGNDHPRSGPSGAIPMGGDRWDH